MDEKVKHAVINRVYERFKNHIIHNCNKMTVQKNSKYELYYNSRFENICKQFAFEVHQELLGYVCLDCNNAKSGCSCKGEKDESI